MKELNTHSDMFKATRDEREMVHVTLNRPEIHNAFGDELISKMTIFFRELAQDKTVRLMTLTGAGKSFCAGADLNWMKSMKGYSAEENYRDSVALSQLFESLNELPFPVLAIVNGACLGGGTGLISSCDYVIASSEAKFGFTEVALGLVPAVISPFVMGKIGEGFARAYFLSGERFDAFEAQRMNLVQKVVKPDDLIDARDKQIKRFLSAGPQAAREAKALIRGVMKLRPQGQEEVRDFTCKTISRVRIGDEGQEGMTALLEKRKPNWIES
jgi:methylglutaconyl-CoA hydratase